MDGYWGKLHFYLLFLVGFPELIAVLLQITNQMPSSTPKGTTDSVVFDFYILYLML